MNLKANEIIKRRQIIAENYAKEKGWIVNPLKPLHEQLSFHQILEIRKQQSWIEASHFKL